MHHVLVIIRGRDRVGMVASVAAALFDLGGDLGEVAFVDIAGEAQLSAAVTLPDGIEPALVHEALAALLALRGAELEVIPAEGDSLTVAPAGITHVVQCEGDDQPGFLARMTEALIDYGANIARLDSSRRAPAGPGGYRIIMYLTIPAMRAEACLAALDNVAQSLGCRFQVETVGTP